MIGNTDMNAKMPTFVNNVFDAVYNVVVDKKCMATLRAGQETKFEIMAIGEHKVYIQDARVGGIKSNILTINVNSLVDKYLIEAKRSLQGLTASIQTGTEETNFVAITCKCGAPNKVSPGQNTVCEYCGTPINV